MKVFKHILVHRPQNLQKRTLESFSENRRIRRHHYESHQLSFSMLFGLLLLFFFTACGSATSRSTTTAATAPTATQVVDSSAAKEKALLPEMSLVGQPSAKLVSGHHIFEVAGKLKNGDSKQHDIYVQAELLNASGRIIGSTAFFNVDNVPGGATASFAIQGTTMQPTWSSI